jgi:hypothetical protein
MLVVRFQTVISGDMRCSLRYDLVSLIVCFVLITHIYLSRTYSSRGLSAPLSNSRMVQEHQEAPLALHRAVAMRLLLTTRRMMTCTRNRTLRRICRVDTSCRLVVAFLCLLKNDRFSSCNIWPAQMILGTLNHLDRSRSSSNWLLLRLEISRNRVWVHSASETHTSCDII